MSDSGRKSVSMHRDQLGRDWLNMTISKWGAYIGLAVHGITMLAAVAALGWLWLAPKVTTAANDAVAPVASRVLTLENWRTDHVVWSAREIEKISTQIQQRDKQRDEDIARLERWLERIDRKIDHLGERPR